ncbi:uncharacterized protein SCDLUD_001434 [Saccharomycodes ludwigii]|uniref:uncharacterized protein n=1 Tax=Saccharomycodes ludwigii TaxID=36035 RepID=UPI001E8AD066|nr:hypothetical protein SCDLUD_001434 [Saccharomycodes ludwigii]KAH3901664.1 hypothetical protein SCDLUD_001434 [Saccharomycodes ludwigii]
MSNNTDGVRLNPFAGSRDVHTLLQFLDAVEIRFVTRRISSNQEKICFLAENLDGDAASWFRNAYRRADLTDVPYETVVAKLKEHFFVAIDPYQMYLDLNKMRQTKSVIEYSDKFEKTGLLLPTDFVSEKALIVTFVAGLKKDICRELRILDPQTLREAKKMALEIELLGSNIYNTDGTSILISKKNNFNALRFKYSDRNSNLGHWPCNKPGSANDYWKARSSLKALYRE